MRSSLRGGKKKKREKRMMTPSKGRKRAFTTVQYDHLPSRMKIKEKDMKNSRTGGGGGDWEPLGSGGVPPPKRGGIGQGHLLPCFLQPLGKKKEDFRKFTLLHPAGRKEEQEKERTLPSPGEEREKKRVKVSFNKDVQASLLAY